MGSWSGHLRNLYGASKCISLYLHPRCPKMRDQICRTSHWTHCCLIVRGRSLTTIRNRHQNLENREADISCRHLLHRLRFCTSRNSALRIRKFRCTPRNSFLTLNIDKSMAMLFPSHKTFQCHNQRGHSRILHCASQRTCLPGISGIYTRKMPYKSFHYSTCSSSR